MKKVLFLMAAILLCAHGAAAGEKLILSGNPSYPPFMWQAGSTIVGASAKLAEVVFSELETPFEIRAGGPWKRVQESVRRGKIDVIVGLYANPDRKQYILFSQPYIKDPTVIFVKKDRGFPYRGWEDLIGRRGTTMQGESFGEKMDVYIREKLTLARMYSIEANFRKLEEERSDYFLFGYYPGLIQAQKHGYSDKIEVLPEPAAVEWMYIGFSKRSRFKHLLPEVNRIIGRLKEEGKIVEWIEEHLESYAKK